MFFDFVDEGECTHACDPPPTEDVPDLGPCCACGRADPTVRNIGILPRRMPPGYEGTGWGCMQCGLPPDGVSAVVCDACLERQAEVLYVILGYPNDKQRLPFAELPDTPFAHDMAYHPEAWVWTETVSDTCGVCGAPLPDDDALDAEGQPDIPLQLWRAGGREGLQMHHACAQRCFAAGTLGLNLEHIRDDD
jgi:hypothetical protein